MYLGLKRESEREKKRGIMWWFLKNEEEKMERVNGIVAVAIDRDKGSQNAFKWAVDHLVGGSTILLIHVNTPETDGSTTSLVSSDFFAQILHTFLPYRIFCTRKNIQCKDVILEDEDISKALIKYASHSKIEHLVLGTKTGLLRRLKATDIPRSVAEGAPDFCTVYSIANGKIHSMKSASRPAPSITQSNLNMRGSDKRISMEALRKQANVRPSFLRGRMTLNNEWDIMWQEENGCSRVKVAVQVVNEDSHS